MRGILYHEIKAAFGWGSQIRMLDVALIESYTIHRRLFELTQKDLPYTLRITYLDPKEELMITPVVGGNGGVTFSSRTVPHKMVTFRYPTEELAEAEGRAIESKCFALEQVMREMEAKCLGKLK